MEEKFLIERNDAVKFLKGLDDESVDLFITDPPYESMEKHRSVGTTTRLKSKWFPIFKDKRMHDLFSECFRVMKKDSHFYVFTNWDTSLVVKPVAEEAGFKAWTPIIWDKVAIGTGYHYRSRYEMIMFFEKGKKKLNSMSIPNVLSYKRVHGGFPTQKPVDLIKTLIEQSSEYGDVVCDPFLGSGSTAVACLKTNRKFIGCDVWDEAIKVSKMRLDAMMGLASDKEVEPNNEVATAQI